MIVKRHTRAGKRRYGARTYRNGKYTWLGTFDTRREARRAEVRALGGNLPDRMSCAQFTRFFLEGYERRVKASSAATAKAALRGFECDFAHRPLASITPTEAEEWARAGNRWRVPSVVTLYNDALRKRIVTYSPFAGLVRKGPGRRHVVPLTAAELERLADCAQREHGPYGQVMRSLVLFAAYSAMRPGELFALEWSDLDFERMRIRVERRLYAGQVDLPKSNRRREIVLTPPARDALLSLPREGPLVFYAKRGGRLSQPTLSGYWATTIAAFGRKVDFYELRHYAGHYLYVQLGLPARVVAVQLGHSGPSLVEELYGHGDVGALEEIERAFADNVVALRAIDEAGEAG